ncbi:SRPBCC family protein [Porticoccus sp. W117]|uniref:SRPBCC family protein n=1 Tax=Porticoccus sp. W117 TaxID=3054777 RepID=UPI002595BA22|nr:SRPBCC family protein [Porticoccus sp. W117]MDM3871677.1 SRPBCC family protein [Porticoccus sp. W117]
MKFLKGLLVIVLLLVVVGFVLPGSTHVERSTVINAPQTQVFAYLNDFQKFNLWSPWAKKDPNTRYQFSGPATGVGSKMSWQSDHKEVGSGSQEITASQPSDHLETFLDFGDHGTAKAHYRLSNTNGMTQITWGFDTDHGWNLLSRYFGLMMDDMVGADFEAGLANLKQVVEGQET